EGRGAWKGRDTAGCWPQGCWFRFWCVPAAEPTSDSSLRPGVGEGVETPLAVALRVVGSLRSPFAPFFRRRSDGTRSGDREGYGGLRPSRSHVSCPCAL